MINIEWLQVLDWRFTPTFFYTVYGLYTLRGKLIFTHIQFNIVT